MKHKLRTLGAVVLALVLNNNILFVRALEVKEAVVGCANNESCVAEEHSETCPKYQYKNLNSDWSNPETSWFEGSDKNEYTLTTAAQLAGLFSIYSEDFENFEGITINLGNDIVLNDTTAPDWEKNADLWHEGNEYLPFMGTLDGCGHSIIGLYSDIGLFQTLEGTVMNLTIKDAVIEYDDLYEDVGTIAANTGVDTRIENCHVKNSRVNGGYSVAGGIVAVSNGTIVNCTVDAASEVSSDSDDVGGIAGDIGDGAILNCQNDAAVYGGACAGGIVGYASNEAEISGCINTGSITSDKSNVGGILGAACRKLTVENCINQGTIEGNDYIGGIVGSVEADATIRHCISKGAITGRNEVGGILGFSDIITGNPYESGKPNTISGCTVSAEIKGKANVGGLVGYIKITEDLVRDHTKIENNVLTAATSLTGDEKTGALIGSNDEVSKITIIKNNFWPAELGENAVGFGAGSSDSESDDGVENNSSYKADGTLTNPIQNEGETIENLGDAIEQIIGGGDTGTDVPETLKATVIYNSNGHGTNPNSETVTIGQSVTLPNMNNDGYYTFTGWSSDSKTYQAGDVVTITKDILFTAQWRDDTPSSGGGGGGSSSGGDSTSGTQFVKNAVYRAYNPNSGEHFYTPSYEEFKFITNIGWNDEGIACMTETQTNGHVLYRLYNPNSGLHHYTLDETEKNILVSLGWDDEGVAWYTSKNEKDAAVYRLYNQNDGQHHYTMDAHEKDVLVSLGWDDEGIGYRSSPIKK